MPIRTSPVPGALAILSAMRDVAGLGRDLTDADEASLVAAGHWMFGLEEPVSPGALPPTDPARLAEAVTDADLRKEAASFITIMAFVDGTLDKARMDRALAYAGALGVSGDYVDEIAEAADGHVRSALGHMVRDNMESITGKPWAADGDVMAWLLPYSGDNADPALADRFRALSNNPEGTFGRAFIDHFVENGYAVPGEPEALNAMFSLPHDSSHVFSGYDTTPRGELLVSTFTAGMHPFHPVSGHILPVIFSWHLDIKINDVAKSAKGAMDPAEFWHAWARGKAMTIDIFGAKWDFWNWVDEPLDALRNQHLGEDVASNA